MIVLDASAVLAAMLAEPGADRVYAVIDESVICSVNAAEVITRLVEKGYGAGVHFDGFHMLILGV